MYYNANKSKTSSSLIRYTEGYVEFTIESDVLMGEYQENIKIKSREKTLKYAVDLLTTNRNEACCVSNDYVRNVADYLKYEAHNYIDKSIEEIDYKLICEWENLHRSLCSHKNPRDLIVCYLSGPEPKNDFEELIKLGIQPSNIWAFEKDKKIFIKAIDSCSNDLARVPKIMNRSIECFFESTPKIFDIVYIDGCGSAFPSAKHTFRMISTLLKYSRLNSPGIIISNFSKPIECTPKEVDYIHDYLVDRNCQLSNIKNVESKKFKELIQDNFSLYYGNYITRCLLDLSSVVIPALRFSNSEYWRVLSDIPPNKDFENLASIDSSWNHDILISSAKKYKDSGCATDTLNKINKQFMEFEGKTKQPINTLDSMAYIKNLKTSNKFFNKELAELHESIKNGDLFVQYLDGMESDIIVDLAINQLAYPMHYNSEKIRRYKYTAKTNEMFLDVMVLDSCRYIYEWMPTIHLMKNALLNVSWQHTFRFALDGLVKQRLNYNNEFFYKASVISKKVKGFESKNICEREEIL